MIEEHFSFSTLKGIADVFRLTNSKGNTVELSALGAGVTSIIVPDMEGNLADVVLGYANYADYLYDPACAGKTPGRYANRIARGLFCIDGQTYRLCINNPPNALHGGRDGFHNVIWRSENLGQGRIAFVYSAEDGEEGYPGTMDVKVVYTWNDADDLTIDYKAVTDKPTIINLTNHTYFNLSGENTGSCLTHQLTMNCHTWLPSDDTDIPIGMKADVIASPMDFTKPKMLGRDIAADFGNLRNGKGYNHFFLIDGWCGDGRLIHAATLVDPKSARRLDVLTTQCGVMLYTGNWLSDGSPIGKGGQPLADYDGVALECQGPPDAPNQLLQPSQILRPGETYSHMIRYSFSVEKNLLGQ